MVSLITQNNIIQDFGYGLYLYYCSGIKDKRDIYNNSIHGNYKAGIWANRSYANIFDNTGIYENYIGVQCMNYSDVEIKGNAKAVHVSETQRIFDNESNQVRATAHSFPYMKWNAIWYDFNTEPLVRWDIEGEPPPADISDNFWGAPEYFDPNEDFSPTQAFIWEPIWDLAYGLPTKANDEILYENAITKAKAGDIAGAKGEFMQLVNDYPLSRFAEASLKEMLPLEKEASNDFSTLQQYYLTYPVINSNDKLTAIGNNLANWCNVEMEDYTSAIQYYDEILANPPSYHDSLFAIFDLNYIDFLINNGGYKSSFNENSSVFDMSAKEKRDDFNDFYSDLLFPKRELSEQMKGNIEALNPGKLVQNFPNPFNTQTEIWFKVEKPANVAINIFDYTGKLVSSLNEGMVSSGNHKVLFTNENLSPGLYFFTLVTDGINSDSKKMTIIK